MEDISQKSVKQHFFEKASAGINAVRGALSKISVRKIAIVLCLFATFTAVSVVMLSLRHVKIIAAGKTEEISTFSSDPAEILKKNAITTSPYDKITFSGFINNRATINVVPAFKVNVTADQKTTDVMITDGTVASVLKKVSVKLGAEDIVSAPLTSKVSANQTITVNRVTYETKTNLKPISFTTQTLTTTILRSGAQKLLSEGKEGKKAITTKIKYVDGKVAQQQTVSETVSVNPVDRTLLVGTAASTPVSTLTTSSLKLNSNGVPTSYSRCITGIATAYSARSGSLTDSGRHAGVGYVAVNPKIIPYGTKLYIMSPDGSFVYGTAIAADTGTFVNDGSGVTTDLYFATYDDCCRFGERTVNIYVLD